MSYNVSVLWNPIGETFGAQRAEARFLQGGATKGRTKQIPWDLFIQLEIGIVTSHFHSHGLADYNWLNHGAACSCLQEQVVIDKCTSSWLIYSIPKTSVSTLTRNNHQSNHYSTHDRGDNANTHDERSIIKMIFWLCCSFWVIDLRPEGITRSFCVTSCIAQATKSNNWMIIAQKYYMIMCHRERTGETEIHQWQGID